MTSTKRLEEKLAARDAEIKRLTALLSWRDGNQGETHCEGCWKDHYACAMEEIERLKDTLKGAHIIVNTAQSLHEEAAKRLHAAQMEIERLKKEEA